MAAREIEENYRVESRDELPRPVGNDPVHLHFVRDGEGEVKVRPPIPGSHRKGTYDCSTDHTIVGLGHFEKAIARRVAFLDGEHGRILGRPWWAGRGERASGRAQVLRGTPGGAQPRFSFWAGGRPIPTRGPAQLHFKAATEQLGRVVDHLSTSPSLLLRLGVAGFLSGSDEHEAVPRRRTIWSQAVG